MKIFLRLITISIFQFSIVAASVSPMVFESGHHTGISEACIYDEIESSVFAEVSLTDGQRRILLVKGVVWLDYEVLARESSIVARGSRGLWNLTKTGASQIKNHKTFGTIYKSKSDDLWWAVDRAGHGGSKFKVFKEGKKGLEWYRDADEFGDFILNKHKGATGTFIPWGQLRTVR